MPKKSQSDLFSTDKGKDSKATPKIRQALTVSAFLDYINELITVQPVLVQGEVTGWKVHPSGVYFSLKDKEDGAMLDCYLNPYAFRSLGILVEDGMEVRVGGTPSIYKPKGRFSLRAETLELAGEGSLKKAYELLKRQLEQEGLFERKRELPEFAGSIGIITSRTGAVIDDFRKNIASLGMHLYLKDVRVEGAQAVEQILGAVEHFQKGKLEIDVLVIMRGGGSLEDLQPFNNELVARAIFASRVPTIVAIGHDRDVPLAQMVADVATSTPTAAAVAINDTWSRLTLDVPAHVQRMLHMYEMGLQSFRSLIELGSAVPSFEYALEAQTEKIKRHTSYLSAVNPERNLKLGYSIVSDGAGKIVKSAGQVSAGQSLGIRFADGRIKAEVKNNG